MINMTFETVGLINTGYLSDPNPRYDLFIKELSEVSGDQYNENLSHLKAKINYDDGSLIVGDFRLTMYIKASAYLKV